MCTWGWGGVGQHRSCQLEQAWTVWCGMTCVFVQVDLNVMLPSPIFSCTCTHTRHATLCDLPLHLHMHEMLRSAIFSCACTHTHTRHATLWDLLFHLHTSVMLRSAIFSCTWTHMSCYALGTSLALAHTHDRPFVVYESLLISHQGIWIFQFQALFGKKMKLLWWILFERAAKNGFCCVHIEEKQPLTETAWTDKKLQVRGVDQTPYPILLHGASLATAMQRLSRPLLLVMD